MSNFKSSAGGLVLQPATAQMIQFRDDAGNDIVVSQADVLNMVCPKATPQEATYFLEMCRAQRLNPFIREAFLVKYGSNPATMVVAEVVFERRANAHPDYLGMECGVVFLDSKGSVQKREGTAVYKGAGEVLIGGWARVHRKGRSDSYAEVSLDEYDKKQSLWKTMPGVMINKCAKGVALRLAFPSDFHGMYSEAEIAVTPTVEEVASDMGQHDVRSEKRPLVEQLNAIVQSLAEARDADVGEVMSKVLSSKAVMATGYVEGADMDDEQLMAAISQAGAWLERATAPTYEV
jgi:phage recombination protein Bet